MGQKIPGVYRVQDNMGVHHATTQELMRAGPRDPWAFGNLPSDAAAMPTKENVQFFYTNALRSSGDKAEAIMRTKKMFDLAGLDVDENGNVRGFKVADEIVGPKTLTAAEINLRNRKYWEPEKSGTVDSTAPPTEAHGNVGNRQWVTTLPAGTYELEDAGDVVKVNRVSEQGGREFVVALPSGPDYSAKDDEAGTHIFAKSPDEPERVPLSDMPIRVGDHGVMANALRRMNERMQRFYTGLGRPNH